MRELDMIYHAIPLEDLCLQWDVCHEMIMWDGQAPDMVPRIGASPGELPRIHAEISRDPPPAAPAPR